MLLRTGSSTKMITCQLQFVSQVVDKTFSRNKHIEKVSLLQARKMSTWRQTPIVDQPAKMPRKHLELERNFEKFVGPDVRILRIAGLYSMNGVFSDEAKTSSTYWEPVAFSIGIVQIFFVASCEFRTITKIWRQDPNYAIGVFTAMFSGILCAVKGLRLFFRRGDFFRLLRRLAVMWEESDSRDEIREENLKFAGDTSFVGKCYVTMVVTLVSSYAVRPYMLLLHHHFYGRYKNVSYDYTETVYPTGYPFPTTNITEYILCISWEQLVIVFVALYWMSSDTIFAQLTTHAAIQFRVLRHDLEFITAPHDDDQNSYRETRLIDRLSTIAKRHHDLYMYCAMIENIYNPIIFLTMLLTGVNMCFCVFRLEKEVSESNWNEVIKYLFHAVTLVVQAVIYCGYADKLTQQSALMARAAYECQWIKRSKDFKIILQVILMRSQKPFNCTAYGFFSVNLNQITVIANTAASYFALLKTVT